MAARGYQLTGFAYQEPGQTTYQGDTSGLAYQLSLDAYQALNAFVYQGPSTGPVPPTVVPAAVLLVQPEYISLLDWAATLLIDIPHGNVRELHDPADWREWADSLVLSPGLAGVFPPSPWLYEDWRSWARQFYWVVNGQPQPVN